MCRFLSDFIQLPVYLFLLLCVIGPPQDNYVKWLAEFKVEASIEQETASLLDGFWKVWASQDM